MDQICGEITSDYQVVNYFLMRCFGQDQEGAAYVAAEDVPLDIFSNYHRTTFCKNIIDSTVVSQVRLKEASRIHLRVPRRDRRHL